MVDKHLLKAWDEYSKALVEIKKTSERLAYTTERVNSCASGGFYLDKNGKPNRTYASWLKANEKNKKDYQKAREKFMKICKKYCINPDADPYQVKAHLLG